VNALSKKWRYEHRRRDLDDDNESFSSVDIFESDNFQNSSRRRRRRRRRCRNDYDLMEDEDDGISSNFMIDEDDDDANDTTYFENNDNTNNDNNEVTTLFIQKPASDTLFQGCLSPFRPIQIYSPKLHQYRSVNDFDYMNM
jgi:hypothetical protein